MALHFDEGSGHIYKRLEQGVKKQPSVETNHTRVVLKWEISQGKLGAN